MRVPAPQLSALSASPSQGPQPVLTQLCLAVALLALHMESWLTVVPDLISNLTTPPEQAAVKLPCLLELLTVLPEEVENFKVGIMPRRRQAFREMLKAAGQQVLQLLLQVCEQCRGQDVIMKRQLRCLSSWLRNAWLPSDQLAASPIMALAFASIASPELFECATDVLVDAVHFSHDHEEHQQLIGVIVPQVLQLVPMYEESLRQEDDDTCRALCRIFTETGEQYLHLILRDPQQALPVVSAVLRGAAHPDREVAEITFNFWYILSEELAGGGRMLEPPQRAACRQLFVPAFVQLVDSLRRAVRTDSAKFLEQLAQLSAECDATFCAAAAEAWERSSVTAVLILPAGLRCPTCAVLSILPAVCAASLRRLRGSGSPGAAVRSVYR